MKRTRNKTKEKVHKNFRIRPELLDGLRKRSAATRIPQTTLLEMALEKALGIDAPTAA